MATESRSRRGRPSRDVRKPGAPTLADIARQLDVSEATVSRALRHHPSISDRRGDLIRRVAKELGYVPNAAARTLARQSSHTLGLIVPDVTDPMHGLIVSGFSRVAQDRGYTVIVVEGARDARRRQSGLRSLLEHQVEGVAFCCAEISPRQTTAELPVRCVFIIPEGADEPETGGEPLGRIRSEDAEGMRQLVDHLLAQGCRRLTYLNGPDIATNRTRRRALLDALEKAGEEPRIREFHSRTGIGTIEDYGFDEIAQRIAHEQPDALLCYDDKIALHMLAALRHARIRVPHDVAVTGFDGIPFAGISWPELTTVSQQTERMGELGAEGLLASIETGAPPEDPVLPVRLVIRQSTLRREGGDIG